MDLIVFLIVGFAAGWLAGQVMKGKGFGVAGNLVIGIAGTFIGGFVFDILDVPAIGLTGSLVAALVGAVLFLWVMEMIKKA